MPLLDIATAQPSFQNYLYPLRSHTLYHGICTFDNEKRLASSWKSFHIPEKARNFNRGTRYGQLVIKAVATLESNCSIQSNVRQDRHNLQLDIDSRSSQVGDHQSSSEDIRKVDEKEKLRRMRISQANKGNTPWNKGRKHSPETLRRIRERTRLAMQDPKVKMKLVNLGHAQSKETRVKIGVGVRIGWERRREKLMLQETCHFEWQNIIAEASRRGFVGEEELQWDSYKILDEELEQEWLESVEQRKRTPRLKGSKRAPKSLEQRRKISEAISAKWTDPAYRDRVYSGLSKYHGIPVGMERKPRTKTTGDRQPRKMSPTKKKADDPDNSAGNETKIQSQRIRLKRSNKPLYKDPLVSSKLEMIKNIRAQRASAENKKTEAITRAKLLIAEAEKAAKALELAASKSPLAQAALIETRKLIAEAIQSIESTETRQLDAHENGRSPPLTSIGLVNHVGKETDANNQPDEREVNGSHGAMASSNSDIVDFGFGKFNLQNLLNGRDEILPASSCDHGLVNGKEALYQTASRDYNLPSLELDHMMKHSSFTEQLDQLEPKGSNKQENLRVNGAKSKSGREEKLPNSKTVTKKWVRGKLVEVAEED